MALRMSSMPRTAGDVRGTRPTAQQAPAPSKEAKLHKEEPLPEGLPALEETADVAAPVPRSDAEIYKRLIGVAEQVFAAACSGETPDESAIVRALRACMNTLREGEGLLAETMRLGLELGADDKRCLAVGLWGLMHDLGMLKVPKEVLQEESLSAEGFALLGRHPVETQRILEDFGPAFARLGKIVVQVHERRDGSGYPQGLNRDEIHEIAQLVGLADTYLAMAHPRIDRPDVVVYNALKNVIDMRRTLFDIKLVKALINIVSIFPLGSLVKLNNNEIGRVIGTSRLHPTRPKVEVLLDSRGQPLKPPRQMVLEEEPMVYIVNPAIEEDVLKK